MLQSGEAVTTEEVGIALHLGVGVDDANAHGGGVVAVEELLHRGVLLLAERWQGFDGIPCGIGNDIEPQALVLQGGGVVRLQGFEEELALLCPVAVECYGFGHERTARKYGNCRLLGIAVAQATHTDVIGEKIFFRRCDNRERHRSAAVGLYGDGLGIFFIANL